MYFNNTYIYICMYIYIYIHIHMTFRHDGRSSWRSWHSLECGDSAVLTAVVLSCVAEVFTKVFAASRKASLKAASALRVELNLKCVYLTWNWKRTTKTLYVYEIYRQFKINDENNYLLTNNWVKQIIYFYIYIYMMPATDPTQILQIFKEMHMESYLYLHLRAIYIYIFMYSLSQIPLRVPADSLVWRPACAGLSKH